MSSPKNAKEYYAEAMTAVKTKNSLQGTDSFDHKYESNKKNGKKLYNTESYITLTITNIAVQTSK